MDDVTANVGQLYQSLQQVWSDLNHLAHDFHLALSEEGRELRGPDRYSHSGRRHGPPADHAWLFTDPAHSTAPAAAPAPFAAVYVLFEAHEEQRKPGPADRPELWFFVGRVQAPRLSPMDVWSYLKSDEARNFDHPPELGGAVSRYTYEDPGQIWHAVCVGLEIGDVTGPDVLRERVVRPLLREAARHSL